MPPGSYLSRIARVGFEAAPSLTPARVLFRSSPAAEGLCGEAPPIFPTEVTPVESRSAGDPSDLTRNITVVSKPFVPSRDIGAPIAPQASLAPLSRPPVVASFSTVTLDGEKLSPRHASDSMPTSNSALSSHAKPAHSTSAGVEPQAVLRKPTSVRSASVEPQFKATRDEAPPPARPNRHSKVPPRSGNKVVSTFDYRPLDIEVSRPESQHRSANANDSTLVERPSLQTEVPRPVLQHRSANANDSTLVQTTFSAARSLNHASETRPTLLIPPPTSREPRAKAPAAVQKRVGVNPDTSARLRIDLLEVRIVPPPPIAPPAPATFTRQSQVSHPKAALSREFSSFGLTQA
jgi:hypothetical protein